MKIEKKIVKNSAKLSLAAKSAIAASFGIAAVALTACEESSTSAATDPTDLENPETGAPKTETSSSSSAVNIPLSHEALSSSAVEALSSAAEPDFPPQAGVIPPDDIYPEPSSSSEAEIPSSSSVAKPLSSSFEEPEPLGGDIYIPPEDESSSSEVEQPSSSSVNLNEVCPDNDPFCIQVHMCNNEDGCMVASMVSTYERFDTAG